MIGSLFSEAKILAGQQVLSFRFKEMRSQMKAYRTNDGGFNLVVALKWPPKLYKETVGIDDRRVRQTGFLKIKGETFGECRALKVTLTKSSEKLISYHNAMPKLCKAGVFAKEIQHQMEIPKISVKMARLDEKREFESDMCRVQSLCHPEIGMFVVASEIRQVN